MMGADDAGITSNESVGLTKMMMLIVKVFAAAGSVRVGEDDGAHATTDTTPSTTSWTVHYRSDRLEAQAGRSVYLQAYR